MSEVIDTSEFVFKGKHAEYLTKLTSEIDTRTKFKIFQRNVDVLIFAPIVGMIYGRKSKIDYNNSIKDKSINYQQLTRESSTLNYNKELVLLLSNKDEIDVNERINKAFRYIYDDREEYKEKKEQCENEYMEYVLGGVEVLYEKIMTDAKTVEDYIDNIFGFIKDIKEKSSATAIDDDELFNLCFKAENKQN